MKAGKLACDPPADMLATLTAAPNLQAIELIPGMEVRKVLKKPAMKVAGANAAEEPSGEEPSGEEPLTYKRPASADPPQVQKMNAETEIPEGPSKKMRRKTGKQQLVDAKTYDAPAGADAQSQKHTPASKKRPRKKPAAAREQEEHAAPETVSEADIERMTEEAAMLCKSPRADTGHETAITLCGKKERKGYVWQLKQVQTGKALIMLSSKKFPSFHHSQVAAQILADLYTHGKASLANLQRVKRSGIFFGVNSGLEPTEKEETAHM
jgi:hypothetical protein